MKKIQILLGILCLAYLFNACSSTSYQSAYKSSKKINYSGISSQLINIQKKWQRTPYRLGGVTPKGADCSGFTQSVLYNNFGTKIPRTTLAQMQGGKKVSKNNLKSGDLLFFKTGRGPNGIHVGIYVQKDEFIHLSTKGGVKKVSFSTSYWKPKYLGARRYIQ